MSEPVISVRNVWKAYPDKSNRTATIIVFSRIWTLVNIIARVACSLIIRF